MFKIREGSLDDFQQLLTLYRELYQARALAEPDYFKETDHPIDIEFLEEVLTDDKKRLYVVEKAGEIIAFTIFIGMNQMETARTEQRRIIKIEEMYVRKDHIYKGIDQHLFEKIKKFALNRGAEEIILELPEKEQEIIDYYEERLRLVPKFRTMSFKL
ncbi:GNAT family N-acetyltransferase [Sediminibacillus albus]|uniref:Acetyltransferase (GNAT) domain-containing protein n=1 Tax=Sediminibacillus albus TaxID=407036 RepID=A0A1G9AR11_9BACI|nr:GNAT family N-acetyltransferase [Sediminibacillus albus]SDK29030.1 Acetyltransferase (GNAT) domain-containing protein [Sediminibacillus albus]